MVEEDKIVVALLEFPFLQVAAAAEVTLVAEVAAEVLQALRVVQVTPKELAAVAAEEMQDVRMEHLALEMVELVELELVVLE